MLPQNCNAPLNGTCRLAQHPLPHKSIRSVDADSDRPRQLQPCPSAPATSSHHSAPLQPRSVEAARDSDSAQAAEATAAEAALCGGSEAAPGSPSRAAGPHAHAWLRSPQAPRPAQARHAPARGTHPTRTRRLAAEAASRSGEHWRQSQPPPPRATSPARLPDSARARTELRISLTRAPAGQRTRPLHGWWWCKQTPGVHQHVVD